MRFLIPLLLATSVFAAHKETGFLDRTVTIGGPTYRYQVYVPSNWTKAKQWPVIFFLHGAGERGDDGQSIRPGYRVAEDEHRAQGRRRPTCGTQNIRASGHNSWDQAYEDPELAKWMFEQRLR
jgi:predicted peptidase